MTFIAKTKYSSRFKSLFELLFQNMTTACFTIDKTGILLETITTQNILLKVNLPAECFEEYVFEGDGPMHIGLGIHINQFFKTVKNKTSIEFSIKQPYIFDIKVASKTDNCVVSLSANIEAVQNIAPEMVEKYISEPVEIMNTDLSKMCRSFKAQVFVTKKCSQLEFSCTLENIYKKNFLFGKESSDDIGLFHQSYNADQFSRISKVSSFINQPVKVYAEEGKPLLFDCSSEIGTIKVFMTPA